MRPNRLALVLLLAATGVSAQQTGQVPTGVRLAGQYTVLKRPAVAVQPASTSGDLTAVAQTVTDILKRDLEFSNRLEVVETPQALATGAIDYTQWNSLNVTFVVASEIAPSGGGYAIKATLHDVPFAAVKESKAFALPHTSDPGFRMAVHATADEIVRWATGQAGVAASRLLFTRQVSSNLWELVTVDSDGENLRRVLTASFIYSPTWSPDGSKVAYSIRTPSMRVELRERDLNTGQDRVISNRAVVVYTPAYSPDGKKLAYAYAINAGTEIQEFDLERGGSPRRLTRGPLSDLSPTYSPDGRRFAFQSDRLGQRHIFVAPADGGEAQLITPFAGHRVAFNAPDWSPTGSEVVFHGESRGGMQIMIADANRPGVTITQITEQGESQDPSWAPDGRHIAFSGVRANATGLYVMDRTSGRSRLVVRGAVQMPEWSGRVAVARPVSFGN